VKFAFIEAERARYPVAVLCRALGVTRQGYYAWRNREPSEHAKKDARLAIQVLEIFKQNRRAYGSTRITDELRENGTSVSRKRVIRLMQAQNLVARRKKRYRRSEVPEEEQVIAANLLDRDFTAGAPNQRWVCDTTELRAGGLKLFLAAVLDLFSRSIVGWSVSLRNDHFLVERALKQALKRRCPDLGLMHHSDRGSPYTSEDYIKTLTDRGITCSMSRTGDCYDNAVMESWFSTLKFEAGEVFDSPGRAKEELFDYIEVFYNQKRRHSFIGGASPAAFERRYWDAQDKMAA
jgi:transposase InsO family protein